VSAKGGTTNKAAKDAPVFFGLDHPSGQLPVDAGIDLFQQLLPGITGQKCLGESLF
jgi:hypothetical protein